MTWIKTIGYEAAVGHLKRVYERIKGPNNNIDNVLLLHSLRPHTLTAHMALYKSVLHHANNVLPKWYLEALGVYVSHLNHCDYCFEHHYAGLKRLLPADGLADEIREAVLNSRAVAHFDARHRAGMDYAQKLTMEMGNICREDVENLKSVGFSDGEILEINQVCSYFNYVNRSVVGLGVTTDGDILGLSPNDSDDPKNWNHQ